MVIDQNSIINKISNKIEVHLHELLTKDHAEDNVYAGNL